MKYIRKMGRVMLAFYIAQTFFGIVGGVWIAIHMDMAEVERIVSCVAY